MLQGFLHLLERKFVEEVFLIILFSLSLFNLFVLEIFVLFVISVENNEFIEEIELIFFYEQF